MNATKIHHVLFILTDVEKEKYSSFVEKMLQSKNRVVVRYCMKQVMYYLRLIKDVYGTNIMIIRSNMINAKFLIGSRSRQKIHKAKKVKSVGQSRHKIGIQPRIARFFTQPRIVL